jgi:Carboxypeptidase regulatory-like domain/TonB dependent receptor
MSKILRFSFVAFLVFAMSAIAFGQGTVTGAIGGVVTNPSKEVVPNASVSVKNIGTNKEDTANSDDQGRFRISNLEPGTYTVTINSSGFSPYVQEKVIVEVGVVTSINANLSVGPVTGNVEVTGEAPVINTEQPDFTNNVNQTQINNLPINGSRWSNFALLNPGTVPDGNFGLISFRGVSGLLNNNTVDGGDNNQAFFSEEKGRTRLSYTVSQSAIREFQVNTSNYSAEYGRAAGGVTNAVTKSGTNQFHGSAEYYQRNNKWGARNPLGFISQFSNGVTSILPFKPEDVRHTIRGTIGGPIKKDKLFFFFSYDEQRRNFPGLGIFSSNDFLTTVNKCTSATDPTGGPRGVACNATLFGQSLKKANTNFSDAQINSALSFLTSLTGPVPRKGNQRIFLPKVDWRINQNHTFTASYNRLRWQSPAGIQTQPTNTLGSRSFGDDFVNGDTVNLRLASTFGANMVNELRYQWGRDNEFEFSQPPNAGEPLTSPAYPGVTTAGTRSPDVFITGGIEFGTPTFLERTKFPFETRKQVADTVTLTSGNHTIKWGGDFNDVKDVQDNLRNYAGAYSYSNINDFVIDYVNFATTGGLAAGVTCSSTTRLRGKCYTSNFNQGFGPTLFEFSTQDINVFVQDEWRYTPRLTVNLGVRYEYERLPTPFLPSNVPQTNNFPRDKNNVGPRIGFAWDMSGDSKNSLRGGYGIYYGRIINSTILNALTNTGNIGGQLQSSTSQAAGPVFPNVLPSAPAGATGIQFFQNHFQAPLIHQMDLVYEREIAKNTVVSASMLMSFGRNLPTFVDTNLLPPITSPLNVVSGGNTFVVNPKYTITNGPFAGQTYAVPYFPGVTIAGTRPNGAFTAMTEIRSIVSSRYYGFVAQLNRRLTNGLQFQANYTRSRSHDTGQTSTTFTANNSPFDAFTPLGEEGISNFDIPNKLVVNAVYSPHFKVEGGASKVLNGWQLSPIVTGYSGVPFTPTVSGSFPSTCAAASGCTTLSGASVTGPSIFTPGGGQNGSAGATRFALVPRNSFRLPKIVNFDMRLSRRFRFNESTALEFLVEGFNIFNRTQVTGLNTAIYATGGTYQAPTLTLTSNFGTTNAAGGTLFRERQIQIAARFQF